MRRLTQSELDKGDVIENCTIGKDLSFPKRLVDVKFSNCVFETLIKNVEFACCYFDKVEWSTHNTLYFKDRTIFHGCKFYGTEFTHCNTQSGEFHNCAFSNSNYAFCVLTDSKFSKCNVNELRIRCSDLRSIKIDNTTSDGIIFDCCDLEGCHIFDSNIDIPQTVPSDGSFIAWKKAINWNFGLFNTEPVIVKLRVPEDAKRVGITNKCRADKVDVLGFEALSGEKLPDDTDVRSWWDNDFHYRIGVVESDWFCGDPSVTCGDGIHFFLNKTDAINYKFT